VIVAWPTSNDRALEGAMLDLTRLYSGPVAVLIRAQLGTDVTRIDRPRRGGQVRFSTAFCMWLQIGAPPL